MKALKLFSWPRKFFGWAVAATAPTEPEGQEASWWQKYLSGEDAPQNAPMPWAFMTLKTGVPGSGKSLTTVREMQLASEGETPPIVYVHGIPDLALPHLPLPVFNPVVTQKGADGKTREVFARTLEVDWSSVAPGSLVVIDEAQNVFPVRPAASSVPPYVAWLNTHRHRPVLIIMMTQHPRLIDSAVRALIGKHQHYRRVFGMSRHICYEWDACSANLSNFKGATKRVSAFPKKAFSAYKSAEAHTKPSFALPFWLIVPVAALALLIFVFPTAFSTMKRAVTGQGITGPVSASAPALPVPGAEVSLKPGMTAAQAAQIVQVAPRYEVAKIPTTAIQPKSWPDEIAGCFISPDDGCVCYGSERFGRRITDLGNMCVEIAKGTLIPPPSRSIQAAAQADALAKSGQQTPAQPVAAQQPPPPASGVSQEKTATAQVKL